MSDNSAKKFDGGKAPVMQGLVDYFPRALKAIADISAYGAQKYGAFGGWARVPDGQRRYDDALMRHLIEGRIVECDEESGKLHMAHRAWNDLATLELFLRSCEAEEKVAAE